MVDGVVPLMLLPLGAHQRVHPDLIGERGAQFQGAPVSLPVPPQQVGGEAELLVLVHVRQGPEREVAARGHQRQAVTAALHVPADAVESRQVESERREVGADAVADQQAGGPPVVPVLGYGQAIEIPVVEEVLVQAAAGGNKFRLDPAFPEGVDLDAVHQLIPQAVEEGPRRPPQDTAAVMGGIPARRSSRTGATPCRGAGPSPRSSREGRRATGIRRIRGGIIRPACEGRPRSWFAARPSLSPGNSNRLAL